VGDPSVAMEIACCKRIVQRSVLDRTIQQLLLSSSSTGALFSR
jgi:hypothetical protein